MNHRVGQGRISNASLCLVFLKTATFKKLLLPHLPPWHKINSWNTFLRSVRKSKERSLTPPFPFSAVFLPGNHVKVLHKLLWANRSGGRRHEEDPRLQCALSLWQQLGEDGQSLLLLFSLPGCALAAPPPLADLCLPGEVRYQWSWTLRKQFTQEKRQFSKKSLCERDTRPEVHGGRSYKSSLEQV